MTIPWVIVVVLAAGLWLCLLGFFWADIVYACRRENRLEIRSGGCTCEQRFFPDALDARCPLHGIVAFVQQAEADARCGDAA